MHAFIVYDFMTSGVNLKTKDYKILDVYGLDIYSSKFSLKYLDTK